MKPIEIIVIIFAVSIVLIVFGRLIYKKATGQATGECECCQNKGKNIKKMYYKKYKRN